MDNDFSASGWAYLIYGTANLAGFVFAFLSGATQMPYYVSSPLYFHVLVNLLFALNVLVVMSGYYLLTHNPNVHKFAFPIAILLLFSVPLGTATGALYLYQRKKYS